MVYVYTMNGVPGYKEICKCFILPTHKLRVAAVDLGHVRFRVKLLGISYTCRKVRAE